MRKSKQIEKLLSKNSKKRKKQVSAATLDNIVCITPEQPPHPQRRWFLIRLIRMPRGSLAAACAGTNVWSGHFEDQGAPSN